MFVTDDESKGWGSSPKQKLKSIFIFTVGDHKIYSVIINFLSKTKISLFDPKNCVSLNFQCRV